MPGRHYRCLRYSGGTHGFFPDGRAGLVPCGVGCACCCCCWFCCWMFGTSLSRICVGVERLLSGFDSCGARCLVYSVIAMISSSLTTPRKVGMMDWKPETTLALGSRIDSRM